MGFKGQQIKLANQLLKHNFSWSTLKNIAAVCSPLHLSAHYFSMDAQMEIIEAWFPECWEIYYEKLNDFRKSAYIL